MDKFRIEYTGHERKARKLVVELGLATKDDIAFMANHEIEKLINDSDYEVIDCGEDWLLVPKELLSKLHWIER